MIEFKISGTLVNDTSTGEIAYAEQLKDKQINWETASFAAKIPSVMKNGSGKFQSSLNSLFLDHYAEFHRFLEDSDSEDTSINTWPELKSFLAGISNDDTFLQLLKTKTKDNIHIVMSEEVPGLLQAVYED